jgi:Glycosyl transferase family 2
MVRFFYEFQCWFERRNILLLKKITYKLSLFLIRLLVPIYYRIKPVKDSGILKNDSTKKEPQVIVSLTTFPPRMNTIWMVLESLLRQTQKPDKIILWLASTQFSTIEDVDLRVRKMQIRGLEIRFCDDYKSHKKYYYAMKEYSNDIIITVDDDIFYPENMLETLLKKHKEYPDSVVCYRAHRITLTNGKVNRYIYWDYSSRDFLGPDNLLMATGCGGVLYPPHCLSKEVFNSRAINELCLNADDIWLKCMSYINGTKTVKVRKIFSEMFSTKGSNDTGLAKNNVIEGHNDIQLKNIISKYNIDFTKAENQ